VSGFLEVKAVKAHLNHIGTSNVCSGGFISHFFDGCSFKGHTDVRASHDLPTCVLFLTLTPLAFRAGCIQFGKFDAFFMSF
jgi:hypothetical protein